MELNPIEQVVLDTAHGTGFGAGTRARDTRVVDQEVHVGLLGGDLFDGGLDVGFGGYVGLDGDDFAVLAVVFCCCLEDLQAFS